MTGGIGRKALQEFYRDHFIFSNPDDTELVVISRTVGVDRVVDEFIFKCTHDRQIDWLLPGVPPSGRRIELPMMAVVNFRGDRLYHEHIWWWVIKGPLTAGTRQVRCSRRGTCQSTCGAGRGCCGCPRRRT